MPDSAIRCQPRADMPMRHTLIIRHAYVDFYGCCHERFAAAQRFIVACYIVDGAERQRA